MNNPKDSGQQGFGSLLYYVFILKKKFRVDETAERMGIQPDTLYRYIRSANIMPPDRVKDLVRATGHVEFLEFFCEPCGYTLAKKPTAKDTLSSVERQILKLSISTGHAQEAVAQALEDNVITKQEYAAIQKRLVALRRKAVEIDERLRAEVRG